MNWWKVADYLEGEADRLQRSVPTAIPESRAGMRLKAGIFEGFANALRAGLVNEQRP